MQFILTLLISVRGSKLLKDGSDLSFAGRGGRFDRYAAEPGALAWLAPVPRPWWCSWLP